MCMTPVSPETSARARWSRAPVACSPKVPAAFATLARRRSGSAAARAASSGPPTMTTDRPSVTAWLISAAPVLQRPALGGVRRPRRDGHDVGLGLRSPPTISQSPPPARSASAPTKNSGGATVGRHAEIACGGEVALGYRPPIAIAVSLPVNQQGPGPAVLGIGAPVAWHQRAKRPAPEVVVQVEQVGVLVPPELGGQPEQRAGPAPSRSLGSHAGCD